MNPFLGGLAGVASVGGNRAVYVTIGINEEGRKEVLGLWSSANEGAKFWLGVMTELRNRGLRDVYKHDANVDLPARINDLSARAEQLRQALRTDGVDRHNGSAPAEASQRTIELKRHRHTMNESLNTLRIQRDQTDGGLHPGIVILDEPLQQNPDPKHRSRFIEFLSKHLARNAKFQTIIFTSLKEEELEELRQEGVMVQTPPGKKWLQLLPAPEPAAKTENPEAPTAETETPD